MSKIYYLCFVSGEKFWKIVLKLPTRLFKSLLREFCALLERRRCRMQIILLLFFAYKVWGGAYRRGKEERKNRVCNPSPPKKQDGLVYNFKKVM